MKIPCATYRLQFRPDFGFAAAAEIVPYLHELGISHVYASPIFRARAGSLHGYDCVDPNLLNPELGPPADWENFLAQVRAHGMGLLLDIVPNHMAYHAENQMLADVLENGPASRFIDFFDICWDHPSPNLQGRVMAPFLGQRYKTCLMNGDIRLALDADGFAATYGDLTFPLALETYRLVLDRPTPGREAELGNDHPDHKRLLNFLDGLERLELQTDPELRSRQAVGVKLTLWQLSRADTAAGRHISECVDRFNPGPGAAEPFRLLDRLLARQHFRLCFWKKANAEINYRRFFDINELISLRQEKKAVFDDTHTLLSDLTAKNIVTGARVDHIDGLADPEEYLYRLRRRLGDEAYLLVEKILAPGECLPDRWPVQGTTGYDFAHWLNALFVHRHNEERFDRIYAGFSQVGGRYEQVVCDAKKQILETRLAGDLDNLTRRIEGVSGQGNPSGGGASTGLRQALCEMLAHFPVYRTYIGPAGAGEADRQCVRAALSKSIAHRPDLQTELQLLEDLLLTEPGSGVSAGRSAARRAHLRAVRGFQQLSAALMAKGVEDTAFYRYHRLVSLNEVGGEPARFGCSLGDFHAFVAARAVRWPHAMNSTATHDSKRGEDMRARLNVLSEIPDEWESQLENWHALNRDRRIDTRRGAVPGRNTEYLLYQTLIGTWPGADGLTRRYVDRINAYMLKAAREAGEHTSWLEPQEEYESALARFAGALLGGMPQNPFILSFAPFCEKIAAYGRYNSLSQCLLKIAVPGIPDFYQGAELLQLTLVDPDNRRPVSYGRLRELHRAIGSRAPDSRVPAHEWLRKKGDGRIKLFVIARALAFRRRRQDLFQNGRYVPLASSGPHRSRIIAFARVLEQQWCVAVVPRFLTGLVAPHRDPLGTSLWKDTAVVLPAGAPRSWENVFTGERIRCREGLAAGTALRDLPVALLKGGADS
jgi:(1->4)-alpha-D-glucan 1-alpha-D-glucosylmutase